MVQQGAGGVGAPGDHGVDVVVRRQAVGTDAEEAVGMGKPRQVIRPRRLRDRQILAVEAQTIFLPERGRIEGAQQHHVGIERQHGGFLDQPRKAEAAQLLHVPTAQRQRKGAEPHLAPPPEKGSETARSQKGRISRSSMTRRRGPSSCRKRATSKARREGSGPTHPAMAIDAVAQQAAALEVPRIGGGDKRRDRSVSTRRHRQ